MGGVRARSTFRQRKGQLAQLCAAVLSSTAGVAAKGTEMVSAFGRLTSVTSATGVAQGRHCAALSALWRPTNLFILN